VQSTPSYTELLKIVRTGTYHPM